MTSRGGDDDGPVGRESSSSDTSTHAQSDKAAVNNAAKQSTTYFDPTQPMSQLIERPPSAASTRTARAVPVPSASVASTNRMAASARLPASTAGARTPQQGSMVASTSALDQDRSKAGKAIKRRMTGPARQESAGVKSMMFTGEVNQTFMQFINALSHETGDLDEEDAQEQESLPPRRPPRSQRSATLPSRIGQPQPAREDDSSAGETSFDERSDKESSSHLSPLAAISDKADQSSDDEDEMLARSINAIHRPIAARRRTITGEAGETIGSDQYTQQGPQVQSPEQEQQDAPDTSASEARFSPVPGKLLARERSETTTSRRSLARRTKLSEKLSDIFGLQGQERVIAEYQCWLLRSVLLQGFLFLTSGHLCFYAYLPRKEGTPLRSGSLSVRSSRTRRYYRHWFVLKNDVLTWYPSSTEPYFPDGHIDLHYCIMVEPSKRHAKHFKVATSDKTWHFSADSEVNRDEWVKILKKVVFRCQNEGESVKIAVPLEAVLDISRTRTLEFSDTLRIRAYDADEGGTIQEYWLSYFADADVVLEQLQKAVDDFKSAHPEESAPAAAIVDTTSRTQIQPLIAGDGEDTDLEQSLSLPPQRASTLPAQSSHVKHASLSSLQTAPSFSSAPAGAVKSDDATIASPLRMTASREPHTYPPERAPGSSETSEASRSNWSLPTSVPAWVKAPPRKLMKMPPLSLPGRKIFEAVGRASFPVRGSSTSSAARESVNQEAKLLEAPDDEDTEEKVNDKFRKIFALSTKESVVAHYPGYLFRGLPIWGKIYVSTTFLCFRSTNPLYKTQMLLPLTDVMAVSKHRSYRIGYSGMVVTIQGFEELFFELTSSEKRNECIKLLESQAELVQKQISEGQTPGDSAEQKHHLDLLDLAASRVSDTSTDKSSSVPQPDPTGSHPAVMFCSTSSDFITFRPEKPLRVTCLTIGSRGDVQPYIALCKGLMAEGHKCRIATHGEYRSWVEGHGIEFAEVGGDPADLMQLMIAHDFFTISFMKEAIGRFRGWLDDLLNSAWQACKGTDLLIESPSAMAGIHVAEALRVPYFRAFTMPWTRTRVYPHAFAVPEHKMGGGYNFMTYTMFDQVFWRATSGQINRWRKQTLGLNSTTLEAMQQHKVPFLYNFSPVVIPPPLDWRENVHVTGYWWLDNPDDSAAAKWQPPDDLLEFLKRAEEKDKKVAFIGFGSIIIPDPEAMTRTVTEAVEQADVYAIVAKGWSDRAKSKLESQESKEERKQLEQKESEILQRPFIYEIKSIPHDWLFPRIHCAVHHGGAGTTGASLRAGLPTIIKPFFGDQYFYADRVATLGIGTYLRSITVDSLRSAIHQAVTDEKQISRARLVGEAIRKEDGVGNAIQCIYRDLEYAKSLIPPPPKKLGASDEADAKPAQDAVDASFEGSRHGSSDADWDVLSRGSNAEGEQTWDLSSRASSAPSTSPRRRASVTASRSVSRDRSHQG